MPCIEREREGGINEGREACTEETKGGELGGSSMHVAEGGRHLHSFLPSFGVGGQDRTQSRTGGGTFLRVGSLTPFNSCSLSLSVSVCVCVCV